MWLSGGVGRGGGICRALVRNGRGGRVGVGWRPSIARAITCKSDIPLKKLSKIHLQTCFAPASAHIREYYVRYTLTGVNFREVKESIGYNRGNLRA